MALVALFAISALAPLAALVPAPHRQETVAGALTQPRALAPSDYLPLGDFDGEAVTYRMTVAADAAQDAKEEASFGATRAVLTLTSKGTFATADLDGSPARAAESSGNARLDAGPVHLGDFALDGMYLKAAAAASDPIAPERPTFVVLLIASQQTAAMLGLGPQPGITSHLPSPAAGLGMFHQSASASLALPSFFDPGDAPGWLLQAAWTVALASFGILAWRGAGAVALLFSRFARDDVLGHDRRTRLFDAVIADPGISFGRLREGTGWAPGVVQHHLRLLERHGVVRRVRDGRTTHFFPAGPRPTPTAGLAPARRHILDSLRAEPGLSLAELAQRQGHRVQSVWDHLDRLRKAGLVHAERRGRSMRWSVASPV